MKFLKCLILLFIFLKFINASIFHIDISNSQIVEYSSFMYSNKSKVPHTSPGNGRSYISFNNGIINIKSIQGSSNPYINILIYSNSAIPSIGYIDPVSQQTMECCGPNDDSCQYGSIVIQGSKYTTIEEGANYKITQNQATGIDAFGYTFMGNQSGEYKLPQLISDIVDTGVYGVLVMNCSISQSDYQIAGDIVFMNPFGYLSGEKFPFIYYNLILSALYVGLFIMWAVLFFKFKDTALKIQFWVMIVILFGFIEAMTNYIVYSGTNKSGNMTTTSIVFMTLFSTLKSGFARALVVLVALGYGIIVPKLPKNVIIKLSSATIAYIIFRGIQEYLFKTPTNNSGKVAYVYLTIPVSILDTLFYWWILFALIKNLEVLNAKKQMVKVFMFRRFIWVLLFSAIASFIILACQIFVTSSKSVDYTIQTGWIIDVVWGIAYFVVLVAICWIWKPNSNNQKFAYSELNDQDLDEVSMQSIDSYGNVNRNRGGKSNENDMENGNITQENNVIEEIDDEDMQNAFSIQDIDEDEETRRNREKTDIADMFSKL